VFAFMWVSPNGDVKCLGTGESIQTGRHRSIATLFPQKTAPIKQLMEAATDLGHTCYKHDMYGYLHLEFDVYMSATDRVEPPEVILLII
jgi:hypothetical protein